MKQEDGSSFNLAKISQTRRTFLTRNPLGLLARFAGAGSPVAQVESSVVQIVNALAQVIEDPTKGAKAVEIISNGVVRAIEGFNSQPTEVVRDPKPEAEKPEVITPQSSLDLRQAVEFLGRVTVDGDNSDKITRISVSIAESDGDVLSQFTSVQKARLGGGNVKRIYRAGGSFEEAQRIMDSSLWTTFGDRAEHAKYLAKRNNPAAGSQLESLKDEYHDRTIPAARFTQAELLDVGLANFYAGTGDHDFWLNQADRAYTVTHSGKQVDRKLLANAAIECGDVSRAWGYFNFATAPKKDVLLTNISGSMELIKRYMGQAGSDPRTIYVLADRGSQFLDEFKEKFGEYKDLNTYARFHRDGEEIFFQTMKDFSMSGGRYSPNNFMQSRQLAEYPGGHIPTIIANGIHWTRVLRMMGEDGEYRRMHSMLRDVWASTNDKTQPNPVALEGYRKAIEMQTDVGDVVEARQTFAQLETELTHTTTDVLLVKAEVMAMIGAAQKKLELVVA